MVAFLGVETSLTGRRWVGPDAERQRLAEALTQKARLSPLLASVLARAGVAPQDVPGYLAPAMRDLMPDPSTLLDMDAAAARIVQAVLTGQRVAIFADYDVDGACSAALLANWLGAFGINATLHVPDRLTDGYGPNVPAMTALAAAHDLIVTVDCGTVADEAIAAAQGTDVVVLDHHLGGDHLPPALAVVNPNRQDETSDLTGLCAAGIVFMTLVAANRTLRREGRANVPDLMSGLDLVALATVADVAPLTGLNRAFVRQGLTVMARRARPGLAALADVARLDAAPAAYHLGFVLGPRINAGGRVGKSDLGVRLLTTADPAEAEAIAAQLDRLNSERRDIEARVRAAAQAQAEEHGTDGPLVWAAGRGWHPGVVGIVASRLKEQFNRPAVVIGLDEDGLTGSGSGRSVPGVDLGASIARLVGEGLLIKGGGHKMAAGLSVAADTLEPAMARLSDLLGNQGAGAPGPRDLAVDGMLQPAGATIDLIRSLEEAGPFGAAAPAPRVALADMRIVFAKRAGETHLRLTMADDANNRLEAICFGAYDSAIGPALEHHDGRRFHFAGYLDIDTWGGRPKPKLRISDAAPASTKA